MKSPWEHALELEKLLWCQHEKWDGIPEVDAFCRTCRIDEMELDNQRTNIVEFIKQVQIEAWKEGLKAARQIIMTHFEYPSAREHLFDTLLYDYSINGNPFKA